MNNQRTSTLLLRYAVEGQQNLLKSTSDVTIGLKDAEAAAKSLGISVAQLQALGNATIAAEPVRVDALKQASTELSAIQDKERQSLQNNQAISEEYRRQAGYLANRLKFAEQNNLAELRNSIGSAGGGTAASGGGGVGETISRLSRAAFNLPDVQLTPGLSSTTASRLGLLAGGAATSLGLTATALAGIGVAGGLAVVALKSITDAENARAESAKKAADAIKNAAQQTASGITTKEITEQVAELERQKSALEAGGEGLASFRDRIASLNTSLSDGFVSQEGYESILKNINAELFDATGGTLGFKDGLGQVVGTTAVFNEALANNKANIAAVTGEIALSTIALGSQEVAQNDLAAAYEETTKRIQENADLLRNRQTQIQLGGANNAVEAQRLTAEQRKEAVDSIAEEITVLELYRDTHRLNEDAARNLAVRLDDLRLRQQELSGTTLSYADVQEQLTQQQDAATEALKAQLGVINESIAYHQELASQIRTSTVEQVSDRLHAIEEERQALATYLPELIRLAPTSQEAAQALAEAQASLTSLSHEYNDQLTRVLPAAQARALTELNADLAKAQTESDAKLRDIEDQRLSKNAEALEKRNDAYEAAEAKRGDALNELADKQAQARIKIERKSNAAIANSIFARDALQTYLNLQSKQEQLQSLKEDGQARERELDKQFAQDRAVANRNYDRARRDAQEAADKAVRLERARQQAEYNERVSAYNTQLTLLRNFVTHANTELANLRVPALQGAASGGTSNPPMLGSGPAPASPYGTLPANPTYGQRARDALGNERIWNGYQWALASQVRGFAGGGIAQGLVRINEQGTESGLNLRTGQFALFKDPTQIFTAPQTQQVFGGSRQGATLNMNFDGRTIVATSKRVALETLDAFLDDAGVG